MFAYTVHVIYQIGNIANTHERKRCRKLDPKNQLFMTLVKLRLNLKTTDIGFRFGLSTSQILRYTCITSFTTWLCFLI